MAFTDYGAWGSVEAQTGTANVALNSIADGCGVASSIDKPNSNTPGPNFDFAWCQWDAGGTKHQLITWGESGRKYRTKPSGGSWGAWGAVPNSMVVTDMDLSYAQHSAARVVKLNTSSNGPGDLGTFTGNNGNTTPRRAYAILAPDGTNQRLLQAAWGQRRWTRAMAQWTAPDAPTGVAATADGKTAIDLSWSAPSDNGGSAITGYQIESSADNSTWSTLVASQTGTTYKHTGLQPGTTRYYRVSAINAVGTGPASAVASATTNSNTAPGQPQNPTAAADGKTAIDVDWDAPSDNGGSAITGYQIESSADNSTWSTLVASQTGTTYKHTGLQPGTTRYYRVSAINAVGTGPASAVASATTNSNTAPGQPQNPTAAADGKTAIDVDWDAPSDNGGSAITGYQIESSADNSTWSTLVASQTGTTYKHTGLQPGTTRYYRVSAINAVGTGPASAVAQATTASGVPQPPHVAPGVTYYGHTIEIKSNPVVRLWTGHGTLSKDSHSWVGAGFALGVSGVQVLRGIPDLRTTFSLVGDISSLHDPGAGDSWTDELPGAEFMQDEGPLPVKIQWIYSEDGVTWQDAPVSISGRLSDTKIEGNAIAAELETRRGDVDRGRPRRLSHEDQMARGRAQSPSVVDRGCEYMRKLAQVGYKVAFPS